MQQRPDPFGARRYGEESRWRPSPRRLSRLLFGLVLFGAGEGFLVASTLGNSPWTVFAEGIATQSGMTVGVATIVVSAAILLVWIPLRQRLGIGTIFNALVIGVMIDVTLWVLPDLRALTIRSLVLISGILLVAVGSGFYLGAGLGPGPRDGLMTGLHRVTRRPVWAIRTGLEVGALLVGVALGGTFGIGTVAFALTIGPGVGLALRVLSSRPTADL